MSKRAPNQQETRLHQASLSAPNRQLSVKQVEAIIPEAKARQNALNFLLSVGLIKTLRNDKNEIFFRGVGKEEIQATQGLSDEELLVYNHIKVAGNEGIWTKNLKTKTQLHQTVMERCLKTLTQKRLIKRVPSVQHITRKIYMLEGLEPSIALTGGPWYTDNELDTEFIQNLTEACYKIISATSFPRNKSTSNGDIPLYPISNAPNYPTASDITNSLRKARLTETNLSVEHIEMLLNVLVLDGKIEKIPSFGTAMWNPDALGAGSDEDEDEKPRKKKKRKHRQDESEEETTSKRKRRRTSASEDSAESSDDDRKSKKSKRKRSKSSKRSDSEEEKPSRRRKSKKSTRDSSSDDSDSDAAKSSRKRRKVSDSDDSDDSSSDSDHRSTSKGKRRADSSVFDVTGSDGWVYRALKETAPLFPLTEPPCGLCPSFEFCKDGGPVNPRDCAYYDEWLSGQTVAQE